jgi:hypothetical protein
MFSHQTRTFVTAATVALLSLAAGTSGTMARSAQVWPVSDDAGEIARCMKYEIAIESWQDAADGARAKGDKKGAAKAARNVKALINEATDNGCFVIY